jgi:hypothetical protein
LAQQSRLDREETGGECGAWQFSKERRTNRLKMRPIDSNYSTVHMSYKSRRNLSSDGHRRTAPYPD